ncbi:MAG: hypothetical protein MPJ25_00350 [Pirellulales bacterium]|nr:hypothetical protein [Pirellulales bacterium]
MGRGSIDFDKLLDATRQADDTYGDAMDPGFKYSKMEWQHLATIRALFTAIFDETYLLRKAADLRCEGRQEPHAVEGMLTLTELGDPEDVGDAVTAPWADEKGADPAEPADQSDLECLADVPDGGAK